MGCSRPAPSLDGLSPTAAAALEPCLALDQPSRDACILQVTLTADQSPSADQVPTGDEKLQVCAVLVDREAQDRCVESAVRQPQAPADSTACRRIRKRLLRESCYLGAADRLFREDMAVIVDACEKTGSLTGHCAAHVIDHRQELWYRGGATRFEEDLRDLIVAFPTLVDDPEFGRGIAAAAGNLRYDDPCRLIPPASAAWTGCSVETSGLK